MLDARSPELDISPAPASLPRVLLADDDGLSRRLLSAALERSGFAVMAAVDGEEALRMAVETQPDLIVLDFEMPALNGAEICHRLRTHEIPSLQSVPIIMLTAHSGEEEELACLQAGANDFVTKPVSREVLAARIHTQLRLQTLSDELRQQNDELARWRMAHEADLAAARVTQRALIPVRNPVVDGWSVQTVYQPLIEVGGDVYGWRPAGEDCWLFWLVDATGHGAAAALVTALAAQLFRSACETEREPAAILKAVNAAFYDVFHGKSFMTACCALIDSHGGLVFAGAGHPPLFVRRANGTVDAFGPHGTVLGFQENTKIEQSQTELAPGDLALLYTDGLFALKGGDGERFQHGTVSTVLAEVPPGPAIFNRLHDILLQQSNGEAIEDDVAAIALVRD